MILKLHARLLLDHFDESVEGWQFEDIVPVEQETVEVRATCVSTNRGKSNHLCDGCVYSYLLLIKAWQFNDK